MISTSENQVIYLGNGQTTHFSFTFKIINYSDLHLIRVDKNGNETEVTSDYYIHMDTSIVDYPGYAPGAEEPEVDQPLPLQTGEKLVIYRDVPITQEDDMPEQWPFDVIESALDKSCIIDQQLQGQLNRSLKINRAAYTNNFDGTIPLVPGKSFRISEDGTKIEATDDPREARELADEAASVATAGANLVKKYGNALYVGTTAPTDNIVYAWINPSEDSGVDETPFLEAVNRLNNRVAVIESKTVDNYTKQEINEKIETKQNVLVAGNNITIAADGKTISATSDVTKSYVDTELGKKQNSLTAQQLANINADHSRYLTAHQDISGKQDKLTAGNNITITNNVIAATSDVTKTYVDGKVTELSAENTKQNTEISKLKTDLEFQKMLAKGITYSFQTDSTEAYSKAIPSGAKVMDLKSVQSGKSLVFNQLVKNGNFSSGSDNWVARYGNENSLESQDGYIRLKKTSKGGYPAISQYGCFEQNHIYYVKFKVHLYTTVDVTFRTMYATVNENGVPSPSTYLYNKNISAETNIEQSLVFTASNNYSDLSMTFYANNSTMLDNEYLDIYYIEVFDLTRMGLGDKTASELDAMFPADYYEYNAGTLTTVSVENMVVKGKNLLTNGAVEHPQGVSTSDIFLTVDGGVKNLPNGTYTMSIDASEMTSIGASGAAIYSYKFNGSVKYVSVLMQNQTFTITDSAKLEWINVHSTYSYAKFFGTIKFQLEASSSATTYTPHIADKSIAFPTECAIGKSAGTVYDTNEFYSVKQDDDTYKYYVKHTQRVGSVKIKDLPWFEYNKPNWVNCGIFGAVLNGKKAGYSNCLTQSFVNVNGSKAFTLNNAVSGEFSGHPTLSNVYIDYGTTSATISDLKSNYGDEFIYYELETPIVTTTELSQNLFEAVTVEGGGSITFVGNNANYHIPIANEEEYLIALSEV